MPSTEHVQSLIYTDDLSLFTIADYINLAAVKVCFVNPASFIFFVLFIGRADLSLPRGRVFPSFRVTRVNGEGVGSNKKTIYG